MILAPTKYLCDNGYFYHKQYQFRALKGGNVIKQNLSKTISLQNESIVLIVL